LQLPFRTQKSIVRLLEIILIPIGPAALSNERCAHVAVWVACLALHVLNFFKACLGSYMKMVGDRRSTTVSVPQGCLTPSRACRRTVSETVSKYL